MMRKEVLARDNPSFLSLRRFLGTKEVEHNNKQQLSNQNMYSFL